ncbi:MAG: acyltransferase [Gordonia sp. (in: high G+C Gram-positive bacteria)]|uniref:acyltransferase family protein n=1 Tax=Gordonia sp. (in: high G+C Gram-positive bacteria) TaxID=84139 RepID=UPI0039E61E76
MTGTLGAQRPIVEGDDESRSSGRRGDIQGLRAVAVLVVVLNHVGVPGFGGGFIGVDVFFVISGYVITRMLVRTGERREARDWFVDFYAKRARRIVPAATLVVVCTVIATFEFTNFIRGAQILPDATAAALFLANFHFIATGSDYAMLGSDPSALQHYWSLAVEEQFYLLWPLLVLIAVAVVARVEKLALRQTLGTMLVVAITASYWHSVVATPEDGTAAYFSPFTRAWELAIGCLIAVVEPSLVRRLSAASSAVLGWAGATAIAWAVIALDEDAVFPGWIAAIPVLGAGALIVSGMVPSGAVPGRLLSTTVPRYVGDLSYSLYLVHWPLFTIVAIRMDDDVAVTTQVLLVCAAFAGAAVMYHFFEDPIRKSTFLAARPWTSMAIVPVGMATVFVVAAIERWRWDLTEPLIQQLFSPMGKG